jgi:hypothetical protein
MALITGLLGVFAGYRIIRSRLNDAVLPAPLPSPKK